MFDQSPHWGLKTAFPSVLRPLLICAKLGRWVCQGFPRPGPEQINVGAGGIQGKGRWRLRGPTCASSILTMSHPSLCASVSFSHIPFFLSEAIPVSVSNQLLPSAAPSLSLTCPLFPQLPGLKERKGGGGEESKGENLHGWGENEVSYPEKQMEGAMGDRS